VRKRFKSKRRSCALCKPHKRGWAPRWKPRERSLIERTEREVRAWAAEDAAWDRR